MTLNVILHYFIPKYYIAFVYFIEDNDYIDFCSYADIDA